MTLELINIPEYWRQSQVRPRGFIELCDMVETHGAITGIWELLQRNTRTGEIVTRIWARNVVTDQGASSILQRAINSGSATLPAIFNNLYITNNSGSTTLTTGLTNGSNYTSLSVAAVPAAIPNNTILTIGYGTAQTQQCQVVTGAVTQGATTITIAAVGGGTFTANATYSAGTAVVPNPSVTDNPASSSATTSNATTPLSAFSGNLSPGAFTYSVVTGAGNRSASASYTFPNSGGSPIAVGNYTDVWLCNISSSGAIAANVWCAHEVNYPMRSDLQNQVTATVKILI